MFLFFMLYLIGSRPGSKIKAARDAHLKAKYQQSWKTQAMFIDQSAGLKPRGQGIR